MQGLLELEVAAAARSVDGDDDGQVLDIAVVQQHLLLESKYMDKLKVCPTGRLSGTDVGVTATKTGSVVVDKTRAPVQNDMSRARRLQANKALTMAMTLWHDFTTSLGRYDHSRAREK